MFRTIRGTKKDAERELTRLLRELDRGSFADPGQMTVAQFLDQWLSHMRTQVRARTYERYESIVRKHLVPALGSIRLAKLHRSHIQDYYTKALTEGRLNGKGGLSAQTVHHHHRVLSEALRDAVRWDLLAANPAASADPPRPKRPTLEIVDPDLADKILQFAATTPLEVPITIALATGMRRGEILGLRWSDTDLDSGTVYVRQSLQATSEGIVFEEPKTERSRRPVSLPSFGIALLKRHRKEQAERRLLIGSAWNDYDLVVERGNGAPWDPRTFSTAFARVADDGGFPRVRFHDLRHGHATLMLLGGVHAKVVSERLGHAGIGITLDTYSHVIPALQADAVQALDTILGRS